MDSEVVKSSVTRTEESSKRTRDEVESDKSKKQKIDEYVEAKNDDQEEAGMKRHIEVVKDNEVAIDAIPLSTKPTVIVEYKIDKDGRMGYFKLIRADGSLKREQQQSSSVSSDFTSKLLNLENPSPADNEIASLLETSAHHAIAIPEITSGFTTTTISPTPFFNPLVQQQTLTFTTTTSTNPIVTLPEIPNFAYVFKFDQRMKKVVDVVVQLQTNKLREEAQAKNQEFLNQIDSMVNLDNSTSNVLILLDSWTSGLLVYKLSLNSLRMKSGNGYLLKDKKTKPKLTKPSTRME
ncbi:hypothetical protein Tco_1130311 [Tanacetum coccineum]